MKRLRRLKGPERDRELEKAERRKGGEGLKGCKELKISLDKTPLFDFARYRSATSSIRKTLAEL